MSFKGFMYLESTVPKPPYTFKPCRCNPPSQECSMSNY